MPSRRGHRTGIVDIGHRAAAGVGLAAPQLEGGADDLVPGLDEQRRRHRRVDPSRHGDEHPLAVTPAPRRARGPGGGEGSANAVPGGVDVRPGGRPPERQPQRAGRRARSTPSAASTWDGSCAPLAQLDAAPASTSWSCSSRKRRASLSTLRQADVDDARPRGARGPAGGTALDDRARDPAEQGGHQLIAPGSGAGDRAVRRGRHGGRRERDAPGHVLRAAAALTLLAAAELLGLEVDPVAHDERAGALGSTALVGATVTRSAAAASPQVEPAERLHGIGVQYGPRARLAHDLAPPPRAAGWCRPRC